MRLYDDLAPWFHLLTAPEDYAEEADRYAGLALAACPSARTLLELGSGGGHNASHLRRRFTCTLTDRSEPMLAVSRSLNPGCEHVQGDMRTLRLGRTFDVVLVHDAVSYLTTESDLGACVETAAVHLRPGGVAVFVPDCTTETFAPTVHCGGHDSADGRGLRYLEWMQPAAPGATAYDVDFVVLLRHLDGRREVVHDRHRCGVFPEATWLTVFERAGLVPTLHPAEPDNEAAPQPIFVALRRA